MKWFKKDKKDKKKDVSHDSKMVTKGLLIFPDTSTVMHVEQILKEENYDIRLVSPPPQYRTGCDLCVEVSMVEVPEIAKMLKQIDLGPVDVVPVSDNGMQPLQLYRTKDFGQYLMVRAANMKITVDKTTRKIVNISGGGCPDIPYLAHEMVGKSLSEAPEPSVIGFSLCAYCLNMAYEELTRIMGRE
jgi:hypothetical protein